MGLGVTADPKMLGGLGDNPFWKAGEANIWKQSMVWYGYFLELPIRKGLLREVYWLLCGNDESIEIYTGWREVQAYKIAPEVIKFHVTNYSILVSLLISQKLF